MACIRARLAFPAPLSPYKTIDFREREAPFPSRENYAASFRARCRRATQISRKMPAD